MFRYSIPSVSWQLVFVTGPASVGSTQFWVDPTNKPVRAGGAGELAGLMIGDYITEVNGLDTGATTFGIPLVRFCPRTRRCRSSCASHASCEVRGRACVSGVRF